jgi:nitrite reductase (NADH) large subunit
VLRNKRIVGVISVGAWADTPRVQEAIDAGRLLWPWQILRFKRSGLIWSAEAGNDVSKWPASARICNCTGATVGDVTSLINGSNDLEAVCRESGASTVCGSCRPFVEQLFTGGSKAAKYPVVLSLGILSLLALAVSIAWLALSPVDQPPGWSDGFRLTDLWNNGLYKQISGFTLIGIVMLGLYVSVKKRLLKSNRRYSLFRNIHVATGLTAVLILLAHTGASMGNNLNYLLMFSFMLAAVVGGMSGLVTSNPSMLGNRMGSRVRSFMSFIHILTVWPIPVVLVFHVLGSYYY